MPKPNPTGLKRDFLRECIDVLSADPPLLRWRGRPRSHFPTGEEGDRAFKIWGNTFAGQTIRPQADGRLRVKIGGRSFAAKAIIAEIGVTPPEKRSGPGGPTGPEGPNDRLAAMRELAGTGKLAAVIQGAKAETGYALSDLTVMDIDHDPYRIDTPSKRRDAEWFVAQVERFISPDRKIHQRGVYYAIVSGGDVIKPDGDAFAGTDENAEFVKEACRLARWLGYLPFERIVDQKNDTPIVRLAPTRDAPTTYISPDTLDIEDLDPDSLGVSAGLAEFEPRQPYRLVFFGEKSALDDVLGPLAEEVGADLYLMGGQISDTYLYQIARDGAADGRHLVVITFSDCDPAGYWDMPSPSAASCRPCATCISPTSNSPWFMRRSVPSRCGSLICRHRH